MKSSRVANWTELAGPKAFLRDKVLTILLAFIANGLTILFLIALKARVEILIVALIGFWMFVITSLLVEYWRRRNFYRALLVNLEQLDQSYLVLETLEQPNFYDGNILYESLYAVNKSMSENIKTYQSESRAFREYIELWIHEVKTPLTALTLMNHNPRIATELRRLDDFVDQVLYFSRAENAERDYLISEIPLDKVVHQVALRNQSLLLSQKVSFFAHDLDYPVFTDAKWLEFILGQTVNNSIKYGSTKIEISAQTNDTKIVLKVCDNGVGISPKDLPRVFEKSFTGQNGRTRHANSESSTGMGLYIAKTLCDKLGHQIKISSEPGQGTTVEIVFARHNYYLTEK